MQIEDVEVKMLADIIIVRDGIDLKKRGAFMGLYGIPPAGGRHWFANNGVEGVCNTDIEAQAAIEEQWKFRK